VEDIQSSDSDQDHDQKQDLRGTQFDNIKSKQLKSDSNSLSPMGNNIDESLFEETHVVQHEIRTMKNQLINQSQQQSFMNHANANKPPVGKKSESSTPANNYNRNLDQRIRNPFDLKGEEFKQTLNFDPDISDLTIKKSLTAISRSSSDKFSRL
jgi:hypothetical protein